MRKLEKQLIEQIRRGKRVTVKELSEKLGISERSVKNYVKNINAQFPGAILSSNRGYSVDADIARQVLSTQSSPIPQTSKERVVYIENRLINHDYAGTVNLYDLCDEIFVSFSTLRKDIQTVKRHLREYDLELISAGDAIEVKGTEKNKRKMLSAIIYKESGINFVNLQSIQVLFPDIDIAFIRATVVEIFDHAKYFTNDYCLINLILHITIAVDRIKHGNTNGDEAEPLTMSGSQEYELSREIAQRLEEKFSIHYTESEIQDMVCLILSRATVVDYTNVTATGLRSIIGEECMDAVEKVISKIYDTYYIDLNDATFITRFALHVKNLAIRCRNRHFNKNPFTQEIKTTCPLIYDMSLHAAQTLEDLLNISINEDETAYIALHLGSTLEEQKNIRSKIVSVLYCPGYYDMGRKIADKINQNFSSRMLVAGIVTEESEITSLKDVDLVISTVPLNKMIGIASIIVQFFYSKNDEHRIFTLVEELERKKRQKKFEVYLRQIITPELIEVNSNLRTYPQCVHYIAQKLCSLGYVEPDFELEVLEREKLSSTAFGNFAIPHSMKMKANKTGISVLISDSAIDWNGHLVQLVLMMCFNKDERRIFNEIYEPLTMTLSEPENVRAIVKCRTYEDFISKIISMI